MRMIFFYTVVLFQALISCNSSGTKKAFKNDEIVSDDTIDKTKQEHSFFKKRVLGSDPFKRDTTINNYCVSYIIHDNDDVIMTLPITDGKGLDTVYYAGREIDLNVKFLKNNILHKMINRELFNSYIPENEIVKYSISYFNVDKVNNKNIFFTISLCIPETDICYWFELAVSNKGDIEIKEITSDEEDEDM